MIMRIHFLVLMLREFDCRRGKRSGIVVKTNIVEKDDSAISKWELVMFADGVASFVREIKCVVKGMPVFRAFAHQ